MSNNAHRAGFGHIGIILAIVLVVGILGTLVWVFIQNFINQNNDQSNNPQVTVVANYDECSDAPGSKILETYPEQCVTADGKTYINEYATAVEDSTYCTPAEKLCFDIPAGWTIEQADRGDGESDPSDTDMLSLRSPDYDLYLHLTTGISGLGGTCDPNDESYTVVNSIPTGLTGFEQTNYSIQTARVIQTITSNLNNYVASMYLSVDKDLETAGEKTDTCGLMFATVLPGRNAQPFDDPESDDHGSFAFLASQTAYDSLLSGDDPEFATKAEAEAVFQTDTYKQAVAILTSVRYQE